MADPRADHITPWLERELTRQLAPVPAPPGLWRSIEEARSLPRLHMSFRWWVWPAFAVLTLTACLGALRKAQPTNESASRELIEIIGENNRWDFEPADLADARAWVQTRTDVNIDVPHARSSGPSAPAPFRLLGVRMVQFRGTKAAAIGYQTRHGRAVLLIAPSPSRRNVAPDNPRHVFSRLVSDSGEQTISWQMRNQTYAVAFSGQADFHEACLLCHAN